MERTLGSYCFGHIDACCFKCFFALYTDKEKNPQDIGIPDSYIYREIRFNITGEPRFGDADAPVLIIDCSDYQCPFCKKAYEQVFVKLFEDYVITGKVAYVIKDFPLQIHKNAMIASIAAHCAGQQDAYSLFHSMLFEKQEEWASTDDARNIMISYVDDLELDRNKFNICLGNNKIIEHIEQDVKECSSAGASGTPTYFINGQIVVGLQRYGVFKEIIERELAK